MGGTPRRRRGHPGQAASRNALTAARSGSMVSARKDLLARRTGQPKETGFGEIVDGMTLRDLHAPLCHRRRRFQLEPQRSA